jgi:hypothetical protein
MTHAAPEHEKEEGTEITSPPAKTAGEEDHSDPDAFRGEDADAPGND